MNDWVVEVKDFEEEITEGLYTLLNENGINKVKELINLKNQQIDQLTNNWNELEDYLLEYKVCMTNDERDYYEDGIKDCLDEILDKMKEIKGGK